MNNNRLSDFGERVGLRFYEMLLFREPGLKGKRDLKIVNILALIHDQLWRVRR